MNTPESTLFNAVPVVSELNRVAGFDPLRFLKKTANGHELDLRYKKLWFRLKYPAGRTRLTPLRITDQLAIIEAKVFFDKDDADPASSYIATMTQENAPAGLYIQAAEHDALDMALTNAGFGIQFAPMPKADTPYAEPTTPVMRSEPAPAPQAAAEQVRTEPAAVRADIEPVVVQQPEQEVVHHAYCTACRHEVSIAAAKHNTSGLCPRCKKKITFKCRGRRGRVFDRETVQVLQKAKNGELLLRIVKAYRTFTDADMPVYFSVYENEPVCKSGFLYAEGTVPVLLVAHLDTVHTHRPDIICCSEDGRYLMSPYGIGGDDRAGVYMILMLMRECHCHILFCEDEELGGVGARKFTNSKLRPEVNYIVELDRRGRNDAVFYHCDNPDFTEFVCSFGFKENSGSFSDISVVAPHLKTAAVNISAGYFNEHRPP